MSTLTLDLSEEELRVLRRAARRRSTTVEHAITELIGALAGEEGPAPGPDITEDPLYHIRAHDSDAPPDLSERVDAHVYGADA